MPAFRAQPKRKTLAELDKTADIPCLVTARAADVFKDGVPLSKLGNSRYKVAAATGLTVRRVQPEDGPQVLASGSVQTPRFFLLESGGLKVQPVGFQDAGEYTCTVSNPQGSVNATAALTVW
ncbi:hypothetical protein CRUP_038689, partial [Coryphaenoides rupestris]